MKVLINKCHPDAVIPTYATPGSAAVDLYALEDVLVQPGIVEKVRTGLRIQVPSEYCLKILPRSGLSIYHPGYVANSPGLIDPDFSGEIMILVTTLTGEPIHIQKSERIAQMTLERANTMTFIETDVWHDDEAKHLGFGSTGR